MVPLPSGGFGLALVARRRVMRGTSKIFVYVFGPRCTDPDKISNFLSYSAEDRLGFTFTFDDELKSGRWAAVGHVETFVAGEWPLPPVRTGAPIGGGPDYMRRFEIIELDDELTPIARLGVKVVHDLREYPRDITRGYIAFEEYVERLIRGKPLELDL